MSDERKTNQQNQQTQNGAPRPKRGEVPDPLKKGMAADGGQVLRGAGMAASAQQSGTGRGESSMSRNWDAGGDPARDERGTVSTGPDTAPGERERQHQVQQQQQGKQQQQGQQGQQGQQADHDPDRGHEQPPLDETTPPDVLARNPDATKR